MTPHGSASTYTNHHCRCDACRAAWAADVRRMKANRIARLRAGQIIVPHGRATTYNNYACRCTDCRAAWATYCRQLRAKRAS